MGRSCTKCGVALTVNNWYDSDRLPKQKHYRCKSCVNKDKAKYEKNHKKKLNETRRAFRRKYRLGQANGVVLKVVKRDYTGFCEICNKKNVKLDYHHWDNSNFLRGLWLCRTCHWIAENIDALEDINSKSQKYVILKNQINGGLKL